MASEKFSALVEIKGGVATSFNASVADTVSSIERLKKGLGEMSKSRSQMRRFAEGGEKIGQLSSKLDAAKVRLAEVRDEMSRAPKATGKMIYAVQKAEDTVRNLERSLEREEGALKKTGAALRAAGIDTKNLAAEQVRLEEKARKTAEVMKRQEAARAKFSGAKESLGRWGRAGAAVAAAGYVGLKPVQEAAKFQEQKIDFGKFVAGAETEDGLKRLSNEVLALGSNSLLGAEGMGKLVSGYGKIGMGIDDALEAAKATETLAVGLEMTADEAAGLVTKIKTGMKLSVKETLEMGDAVNYIGDVTAADGKRTAEILQRQGSLIKATTTLTNDQIVALAASFDMAAPNAESGATAMKNFARGLSRGIGTSKVGRQAWELLGMNPEKVAADMQKDGAGTMVKVLRGLQKVAGKNKDFAISRIFGEESKGAVGYLLGNVDEFERNMKSLDDRQRFLGRSAEEQARQLSGLNAKWTVFGNKMDVLKIKVGEVALPYLITFLDKVSMGIDAIFNVIADNPGAFKWVSLAAGGMFLLTAAVVGLGFALSGVRFAMSGFNLGLANMAVRRTAARNALVETGALMAGDAVGASGGGRRKRGRGRGVGAVVNGASMLSVRGWGRIAGGLGRGVGGVFKSLFGWVKKLGSGLLLLLKPVKLLGVAWRVLRACFFSLGGILRAVIVPVLSALGGVVSVILSPIGLLVAGIAAVGVAAWKYWEPIKGWADGVWTGFMGGIKPVLDVFGEIVKVSAEVWNAFDTGTGTSTMLGKAWGYVTEKLKAAWTWVKELFTPVSAVAKETKAAADAGVGFGQVLAGTLASGLRWVLDLFQKGRDFIFGFGEAFQPAIGPAKELLGELKVVFGELWAAVKDLFGTYVQLGDEFEEATGQSRLMGEAWDWLCGVARGVWTWVKELFTPMEKVNKETGSATEAGKEWGKVIGENLCKGLAFLVSSIKVCVVKVKVFKDDMVAAFKAISEFCEPIIKGIVSGIDSITTGFGLFGEKNGKVEVTAAGGGKVPELKPAPGYSGKGVENHNAVTVNVNGAGDPRETGRRVVEALEGMFRVGESSMMDDAVLVSV